MSIIFLHVDIRTPYVLELDWVSLQTRKKIQLGVRRDRGVVEPIENVTHIQYQVVDLVWHGSARHHSKSRRQLPYFLLETVTSDSVLHDPDFYDIIPSRPDYALPLNTICFGTWHGIFRAYNSAPRDHQRYQVERYAMIVTTLPVLWSRGMLSLPSMDVLL